LAHQRPQGLEGETHHLVQPPSTATIRNTRSTRVDHSQPTPAPIQVSGNNSETPNRKLRLSLKWDKTPVNLWLDLDGPAAAFFQALRDVSKRRQVHDWDSLAIYLKTKSQSPGDIAYRLSLDAEELDADWETTVEWLEENKRDKTPHIYGSIEVEGG
jgi:hypothetical protein